MVNPQLPVVQCSTRQTSPIVLFCALTFGAMLGGRGGGAGGSFPGTELVQCQYTGSADGIHSIKQQPLKWKLLFSVFCTHFRGCSGKSSQKTRSGVIKHFGAHRKSYRPTF